MKYCICSVFPLVWCLEEHVQHWGQSDSLQEYSPKCSTIVSSGALIRKIKNVVTNDCLAGKIKLPLHMVVVLNINKPTFLP
jgi:hypothetical protein